MLFRFRGGPVCCLQGSQGYLAHKKSPPPYDHRSAIGIVLIFGPRGALLLMSEVPLCPREMTRAAVGADVGLQGLLEIKDTRRSRVVQWRML